MVCESDRRRVKHPEQSVGVVITGLFSAWDERRGIRKVRGKALGALRWQSCWEARSLSQEFTE